MMLASLGNSVLQGRLHDVNIGVNAPMKKEEGKFSRN